MLNALEQKKLERFKISEERFRRESKALLDLGYDVDAIKKLIIRISSKNTVMQVIARTKVLSGAPYHLSLQQIVKIASCIGGVRNIKALENGYHHLRDLGFNAEQIMKMVSHGGGAKNLEAVENSYLELKKLGFTSEQIIKMVNHDGGSKNLAAVQDFYHILQGLGFNVDQIIKMVSYDGGSKNLEAVVRLYDALIKQGYSLEQIVHQVGKNGGSGALTALLETSKDDSWEIKWFDKFGSNLSEDVPDLRAVSPFSFFSESRDDTSLENPGLSRLNF